MGATQQLNQENASLLIRKLFSQSLFGTSRPIIFCHHSSVLPGRTHADFILLLKFRDWICFLFCCHLSFFVAKWALTMELFLAYNKLYTISMPCNCSENETRSSNCDKIKAAFFCLFICTIFCRIFYFSLGGLKFRPGNLSPELKHSCNLCFQPVYLGWKFNPGLKKPI